MSDLQRFVTAQDPIYERVLSELRAGRKTSHWMWFVFPQIAGLGSSPTSVKFALASLDEARAYLEHPILGPRLRQALATDLAVSRGVVVEAYRRLTDEGLVGGRSGGGTTVLAQPARAPSAPPASSGRTPSRSRSRRCSSRARRSG